MEKLKSSFCQETITNKIVGYEFKKAQQSDCIEILFYNTESPIPSSSIILGYEDAEAFSLSLNANIQTFRFGGVRRPVE